MTKVELEKLAEKYQKKADDAFRNYQETGITRYGTSYRNNEEMADALRMAASAADEHAALYSLRGQIANFAWRAKLISSPDKTDEEVAELTYALIRDIVSYGKLLGLIGGD